MSALTTAAQQAREEREVRIACAIDVMFCDTTIATILAGVGEQTAEVRNLIRAALHAFAHTSGITQSFDDAVKAIGDLADGWGGKVQKALYASHDRFLQITAPDLIPED